MGFFSKSRDTSTEKCALCDRELRTSEEKVVGLSVAHALILDSDLTLAKNVIDEYQPKANAEQDPDKKILYLKTILDQLYKIQVKYYENGIKPLKDDIDDLIDQIIYCISTARL